MNATKAAAISDQGHASCSPHPWQNSCKSLNTALNHGFKEHKPKESSWTKIPLFDHSDDNAHAWLSSCICDHEDNNHRTLPH